MIREKLIFKVPVEIVPSLICSSEGLAFIAAHETATGLTMGDVQKLAICGLVARLQGNGTTNGSNIWDMGISNSARMWVHAPSNDSDISFEGCNVELFSASTLGSFSGFVTADLTVRGLEGGSAKYFNSDTRTGLFNESDISFGVYSDTNIAENTIDYGQDGFNYAFIRYSNGSLISRIGNTINVGYSNSNSKGLFFTQRSGLSRSVLENGVVKATNNAASQAQVNTREMLFHAYNIDGPTFFSSRRLNLYFIGLDHLDTNEAADFYEAIQWYQTNVITGGREV